MAKIVNKAKYKKRILDEIIEKKLKSFGAVCIEGPKWCGKTWLASYHAKCDFLVGDPKNNFQNKRLAELNPSYVLDGAKPLLIDEWQEVPTLWDAVRYEVDRLGTKGNFILTGSSTPTYKGILHSGAGRIGKIRMRTMSLYESGDSSGMISLKDICLNKDLKTIYTGEITIVDLAKYIIRGGFPGCINMGTNEALTVITSYIESILNNDVFKLDFKKYNLNKLKLLLKSLARNESTTVTIRKLADDILDIDEKKIDTDTISTYLDLLNRLFVLDNQEPYSINIRSSLRVKQALKYHFCDPSITSAILNLTPNKLINDLETFGFLFEALCERDLKIYAESFNAKLFHYQDYDGNEIDAIIELEDGNYCAFEIKLGANQIDKAANNLIKIKNKILKNGGTAPNILCVICGLTNVAYKRDDGVFVLPITALKN